MRARVVTYIGQLGKNNEIIRGFQEQITRAAMDRWASPAGCC